MWYNMLYMTMIILGFLLLIVAILLWIYRKFPAILVKSTTVKFDISDSDWTVLAYDLLNRSNFPVQVELEQINLLDTKLAVSGIFYLREKAQAGEQLTLDVPNDLMKNRLQIVLKATNLYAKKMRKYYLLEIDLAENALNLRKISKRKYGKMREK